MEDKIKVGEYVRTISGKIVKFKKFSVLRRHSRYKYNDLLYDKIIVDFNGYHYKFDSMLKHSKTIIDLVEVGDFIGNYVVENIYDYSDGTRKIFLSNGFDNVDDEYILQKGIVTKEKFNSIK